MDWLSLVIGLVFMVGLTALFFWYRNRKKKVTPAYTAAEKKAALQRAKDTRQQPK